MKKKIWCVLVSCLLLAACAVDDSPEARFDAGLSEMEALDEMQTTLTIENEQKEVLAFIETKSSGLQETPQTEMRVNHTVQSKEADDALARFCRFDLLTDGFTDISVEEKDSVYEVSFATDKKDEQALTQAFAAWIDSPFQHIERVMILNQDNQLTKVVYRITAQEVYTICLVMEDGK